MPSRGLGLAIIVFGVISIGAGIAALVYPGVTLLVISAIIGVNLLVLAISDLIEALTDSSQDGLTRVMLAILALFGLIAGLIVIRHPWSSLAVMILVIGIYLVVAGAVGAVRALATLTQDRAGKALVSLATMVLGIIVLAVPGLSLVTLAALAGGGMIVRGIGAIMIGLQARKIASAVEAA